ncbi:transposase [Streptomyces sp. NPDC088560]|uniref:transposase n=1 Tax=Streptomyces sp. NPDC088560 TaxID=3365868 RepID=UPI0038299433
MGIFDASHAVRAPGRITFARFDHVPGRAGTTLVDHGVLDASRSARLPRDRRGGVLTLVREVAPEPLDLLGVGPITVTQILVSWSHPGEFRSEAALASFAGVSPIPASSELVTRSC